MKCLILFLTLVSVVVSSDYYDEILDSIDIDALVSNDEEMTTYTDCFLRKRDCEGFPLKIIGIIPEIIETGCIKCSPKFRYSTKRYYEELEAKYPKKYEEFKKIYDPEGKGLKKLLKVLADSKASVLDALLKTLT